MIIRPMSFLKENCIKWQKYLEKNSSWHLFFAYCGYVKISDIRQLSNSNHRAMGGLSDGNNRIFSF